MAFDGTEGGQISLTEAANLTAKFRSNNPNSTKAHFFGREILTKILNQENCVGIRMYYGLNEDQGRELVLVGVDAEQNDLLDLVADYSAPCPGACANVNELNS